jgi:hypothetical protein
VEVLIHEKDSTGFYKCVVCQKSYQVPSMSAIPICCGSHMTEILEQDFQDLHAEGRAYGTPTTSQLDKVNKLAKRTLSKDEVFVFGDKLCGDMVIPNRFIQLHKSLLDVFKANAVSGISMLIDHPWAGFFSRPKASIPYGRTFDSWTKRSVSTPGETWGLYGDHYVVRGKTMDGISTDSIIQSVEDGTFFDTSIGWGADCFECSICGNDIRDYENCTHWPGVTYKINGEERLCYAIAKPPGYLMENSIVFDGAYPTAGVLSQADGGEDTNYLVVTDLKKMSQGTPLLNVFSARNNSLITLVKKTDIPRQTFQAPGMKGGEKHMEISDALKEMFRIFEIPLPEAESMSMTEVLDILSKVYTGYEAKIAELNAQANQPPQAPAAPGDDVIPLNKAKAIEVLGKEMSADAILDAAHDGITLKTELIDDTVAWGVRAQGNDFKTDSWRQMLSEPGRTLVAIKEFRDGFKTQAQNALSTGRKTREQDILANGQKSKSGQLSLSDEYYK